MVAEQANQTIMNGKKRISKGKIKFEALPCSQKLYDCSETIMGFPKGLAPYGEASSRTCKKGEPTLRKFRPSPGCATTRINSQGERITSPCKQMLKNNFQTLYRAVGDDSHENQPWETKTPHIMARSLRGSRGNGNHNVLQLSQGL
ncbi:hypothetical protein H5410_034391 [Solanum commersonii]|uniref:Uncharacterized protein n=1 Tax=Solanum commersonii TaxID=4109 RepID=A0A9J5YT55_SOLCO|nr:hypothetical protein H5410_034391 [Solanum commersonii]